MFGQIFWQSCQVLTQIIESVDPLTIGVVSGLVATGVIAIVRLLVLSIRRWHRASILWGKYTKQYTLISGQIYDQLTRRYVVAGDIRALLAVVVTLQIALKLRSMPHRFSDEMIPSQDLAGNVFSVGGPKHNLVTREIFKKYNEQYQGFPIHFDDSKMCLQWTNNKRITQELEVNYKREGGRLSEDYGVLIRGVNPLRDSKTGIAWVIAGCGSNGCNAAADQLSDVVNGPFFRAAVTRRCLVRGKIGVVVFKVNFIEGNYSGSEPILWAYYRRSGFCRGKPKFVVSKSQITGTTSREIEAA